MNRRTFGLALLALLTGPACSLKTRLANTRQSPEALAVDVLAALERRDRAQLEAMAVSEAEFRDCVWPRLPASRPERNLPMSYVWGDLQQKSRVGLAHALHEHGQKRYTLDRVTFSGETDYGDYRVHREARLAVRTPEGEVQEIRVCGSMLEQDGAWKVFSYVTES